MQELIRQIVEDPDLRCRVAHRAIRAGREPVYRETRQPVSRAILRALEQEGIGRFYLHQAEALDHLREGSHVMAVTPTASGKSLIYFLPTLEAIAAEKGSRALYVYPYKALERDQLQALTRLGKRVLGEGKFRAAIYDGDTSQAERKRIRACPPDVLITNPDMLHLGILAYHAGWRELFRNLRFVVIDELHVYRGIFGSHFHHILMRLRRICSHYGSDPRFVVCSATVANPAGLGDSLVALPFEVVTRSGSPQAAKHFLFLNPSGSPYVAATELLARCVRAGLRTIAFTKARKVTELIHSWILQGHPDLAARVSSYRAGYLPEERREIERRLAGGDLLGVVSTSALELGIDIGGLDVCILVGYPGSIMSSWQRIGRVGRQDRESLVILVALPDALDQYFIAHPQEFFERGYEQVVSDPANPVIASAHLECAAAELSLTSEDRKYYPGKVFGLIPGLTRAGRLREAAEGSVWHSGHRNPQRRVSLRSIGESYPILDVSDRDRVIGSVDGVRAFHECHEGAIYLHHGQQYRIRKLDIDERRVEAVPATCDYYTEVLAEKETAILEVQKKMAARGYEIKLGRLKVTEQIREYCKRRIRGQERLGYFPLDLPLTEFETVGLWMELPVALLEHVESRQGHFMGGIHAVEHAAISLFPLFAICDRGDIGGISYPRHPEIGRPAIFIYDGYPGGIGLAERGFEMIARLQEKTLELIRACPCEAGCPSCIHSPKCGNGNKPLDKQAALMVLDFLTGRMEISTTPDRRIPSTKQPVPAENLPDPSRRCGSTGTVFFDLETQLSAEEVGGWHRADRMKMSLGVVFDERNDSFRTFREEQVDELLQVLYSSEKVVGFNIKRFDYKVLSGYTDADLSQIETLDMLDEIHALLGFRLKLGHLAEVTLGAGKIGDGLQSLEWFRDGRIDLVEEYCRKDVEITRDLFRFGRDHRYLLYRDKQDRKIRLPVDW
ncbi:MAG: DEAD/DEAH box helicase [Acidobacteriota bacterium]